MTLPTEKTPPIAGLGNRNLLLYGDPKTGKSTLAAELREQTLFLATEPGLSAIDAYVEHIHSWPEFLAKAKELSEGKHNFETVVIDTVDELARMCAEHVIEGLAMTADMDTSKFIHTNDFGYGKGADAVAQEFRLKVSKLCNLPFSVIFISHTKEVIVKDRTGLETTKRTPDAGQRKQRDWLLGYVDLIAFAEIVDTPEGNVRQLRFWGDTTTESGGRVERDRRQYLPQTCPLDAEAVNGVFSAIWGNDETSMHERAVLEGAVA